MDLKKLPFNALIVGPTNSGKTQYLINQLRGPFRGKLTTSFSFVPPLLRIQLMTTSWQKIHTSSWLAASSMRSKVG